MNSNVIGWYYPNEPGARSLRDARPLYVGTEKVSAQVYQLSACSDPAIAIFIGPELIYEGPLPLEVTESYQINPLIQHLVAHYVAGRDLS